MTIIEQSERTRRVGISLGLFAAGLFAVATNGNVIAGMLPDIARSLGTSQTQASLAITWYAIVVAVGAPAVSVTLARVPRTGLMTVGMALVTVGTMITAAAPNLVIFTVSRVLAALGGAALVPTATAAAPAIVVPARRGRALAITSMGFILALAVGAPVGTALAEWIGWRPAMATLAGVSLVITLGIAIMVRGIPDGAVLSWARRFGVLANRRILLTLLAVLFLNAAFYIAYLFSSTAEQQATGGNGTLLAVLLLCYGAFGLLGNHIGGSLSDRLDSRRAGLTMIISTAVALLIMIWASAAFWSSMIIFAVWGVAAAAALVAAQHALVAADPDRSVISLSWYSTALYAGISITPLIGSVVLPAGALGINGAALIAAVISALLFAVAAGRVRTAR